jgi:hypothetical protein
MRQILAHLLNKLAAFIDPPAVRRHRSLAAKQAAMLARGETKRVRPYKSHHRHAPVDLVEAQRLYQTGLSLNDVVDAVKGTRASFDVKKLLRKTFRERSILRNELNSAASMRIPS